MPDIIIKPSIKNMIIKGFYDINYFIKTILEEDVHLEQAVWLKNSIGKQYAFLRAGNRWGKGDCGMYKGAYTAFYKPVPQKFKTKKIHLLNTSISQDQSNIICNKFEERLLNKKYFSWLITGIKYVPFPHIIFKNNVVWWFRNAMYDGKFLEGRSYFWINFDEADLQKGILKLSDEVIEPRLWDYSGNLDLMTTPRRGKRNSFHVWKKWESLPDEKKFLFQGDSRSNTFISPDAIERMNNLPPRLFKQNVLGDWVDESGAISDDIIEYSKNISTGLLSYPEPGHLYIKPWDLARSSTYCVCPIIDIKKPHQIVHCIRFKEDKDNRNPEYWKKVEKKIKSIHRQWPGTTVIDYTGVGDVVGSYLTDIDPIMLKISERMREDLIENGLSFFESGNIGLPYIEQVEKDGTVWTAEDELRDFELNPKNIIWDFVCALFLGLWVIEGKHKKSEKPKEQARPSIVNVRGVKKHAMV